MSSGHTIRGRKVHGFHKVGGRVDRLPTAKELKILNANAEHIKAFRPKLQHPNIPQRYYLDVVRPTQPALEIAKRLNIKLNRIEIALDIVFVGK
jgi:hypothetical protein